MTKRRLLAALLVLILAVVAVNLTVARFPSMPPAGGGFLTVDGHDIHYLEQTGSGTPVVILHGLPGTLHDFEPVIAKMPNSHVFSLDRPGFGWSKGGWVPFQQQIDIVHGFITQLGLGPAIVVGHSFGGSLALGLAGRYPQDVARLVLIAPAAGGIRLKTMDVLQARYILFSHLPVVKSIVRLTFGNIALRLSDTSARATHSSPSPSTARGRKG